MPLSLILRIRAAAPGRGATLGSSVGRYLAAVLIAALTLAAKVAIFNLWGQGRPYLLAVLGVTLSAWLTGRGPALFATLLLTAGTLYLFHAPTTTWIHMSHLEVVGVLQFIVESVLIVLLCTKLQRIVRELEARGRQLQEINAQHQLVLSNISDYAIFLTDPTGHITTWSVGAESITGFSAADKLGEHFSCLLPPLSSGRKSTPVELAEVRRQGEVPQSGWYLRRDGGRWFGVGQCKALRDDSGKHIGYITFLRDSTLQRRREEELRQVAEFGRLLTQLLDLSADMTIIRDEADRIVFWSATAATVYGWSMTEAIGREAHTLLKTQYLGSSRDYDDGDSREDQATAPVGPTDALAPLRAELSRTGHWEGELIHTCKNGSQIIVASRWTMQAKGAGNRARILEISSDITLTKATEQALQQAKTEADLANRAKSAFLTNVSHEIRSPLNAILGFTDLLLKPDTSADDLALYAQTIRRNGQLLARLIGDILDLSKVEAGKLEVEAIPVSMPSLLSDIQMLFDRQLREAKTTLLAEASASVPSTLISDPTRLRQILINIVGNAVKFSPGGTIILHVSYEAQQLVILVKDTGPGLSAEEQARLFRPFSQADASTTRRYGGTGLGLDLSRRLARLLGGDVVISASAPGAGTTVRITVKALVPPTLPTPKAAARAVRGSTK